jgi:hypothetical protein
MLDVISYNGICIPLVDNCNVMYDNLRRYYQRRNKQIRDICKLPIYTDEQEKLVLDYQYGEYLYNQFCCGYNPSSPDTLKYEPTWFNSPWTTEKLERCIVTIEIQLWKDAAIELSTTLSTEVK